MKNIIKTFVFISSIFSFSYAISDSSFYPINQIGNEWEYSPIIQTHTYKERVIDTIRVKASLYYKLLIDKINREYFIRETNNKIFILNLSDSSESILLDFSANVGDSWQLQSLNGCFWGSSITLVSKNDTVITPIDTFYNCYRFSHEAECADAGILYSWYAKGIGKVKHIENYIWGYDEYALKSYNLTTGIINDNSTIRKLDFSLYQNYPNPFNPTTNISYYLANSDFVTLKVFDLQGREVAVLLNEQQESGYHNIQFDGSKLSSGVFFYTLRTSNFSETKKLILMR
jgi:hypothetical protein